MTKKLPDETQNSGSGDPKTTAGRRKGRQKTRAEIDALGLRKLKDEFGDSPIALGEPKLFGVPARAIECARQIVKRTLRSNKGFQPTAVAAQVAQICGLTPEMERLIRDWLDWLRIRTWVLAQANRSPVIAWLNTDPHRDEKWSQDLHNKWVEQINSSWRKSAGNAGASSSKPKQAASQQASSPVGSKAPVPGSNDAIPISKDADREPSTYNEEVRSGSSGYPAGHSGYDLSDHRSQQEALRSAAEKQSLPLLASAKKDLEPRKLNIPPVERKHFRTGQPNINAFFNAMKTGSEPQIRAAAQTLADDPQIFEEICSVSQDHRRYVGAVFVALGMSIPGSDR
jgi:hypothetical protein